MKKGSILLSIFLILTLFSLSSPGQETAEFVLLNGKVFTVSEKNPQRIKELPKGAPVWGIGSFPNTSLFPGLGWPTKDILDEVAPDNPVVIRRGGGHAVWVNSRVLQQSGITQETEVPYGGEIVLDPETGEPTGILKEAAQNLMKVICINVSHVIPNRD